MVTCVEAEREGAGVSGGGGEQVIGVVTVAVGLSSKRGFGVRRGGEGVTEGGAEVEEEEEVGAGSEGEGWLPLDGSFVSDWLWRTPASRSMLQQVESLRKRGLVLHVSPAARHRTRAACLRGSAAAADEHGSGFIQGRHSNTASTTQQQRELEMGVFVACLTSSSDGLSVVRVTAAPHRQRPQPKQAATAGDTGFGSPWLGFGSVVFWGSLSQLLPLGVCVVAGGCAEGECPGLGH